MASSQRPTHGSWAFRRCGSVSCSKCVRCMLLHVGQLPRWGQLCIQLCVTACSL